MQTILFVLNAPPYGSERILTALRLASALAADKTAARLTVFLASDAVVCAHTGQQVAAGNSLGQMLGDLVAEGVEVFACRTCLDARGMDAGQLLPGVGIGTMPQLAGLTLAASKVLSF
jgi:uncharacterized protein involved in oxidation of intracellular sulfur